MINRHAANPGMRRTDGWESLAGRVVDVHLDNDLHRQGIVEDVMPDSSGLWIAAQGSCSRGFVDKASGYTVWTDVDTALAHAATSVVGPK